MNDPVRHALLAALGGSDLTDEETAAAIGTLMDGYADEIVVAALLTALHTKNETADELVGAARAMRQRAVKIPVRISGLLDTCGTGGDGLATFNISTATALVAAAAGVPVAKHGNRAASSSSGSADVLEALGVNINLTPEQVATCIEEAGIGFCFAPLCHGAMKNVAPIRKRLGFRTIFNLLGPLTNPAGAEYQLVGAGRCAAAEKLANAIARFGPTRAIVVCGNDELDEVSTWGTTTAFLVEGSRVRRLEWRAEAFGASPGTPADLRVGSAAESAKTIRSILSGEAGPGQNIVAANAAAAFYAARRVETLADGLDLARRTLGSGTAEQTLGRLIEVSNRLGGTAGSDRSSSA